MRTTTLWLDQCIPGMRVAETISNRFMAVIVNEGTVLNEHVINKLKFLNYQKVRIYIDLDRDIEKRTIKAVQKEYEENVSAMKFILDGLSTGRHLDMSAVAEVTDSIYDRLGDFMGVFTCLNQLREADEYTYTHSVNVSFICLFIAKWLHWKDDGLVGILQAGLLHDIGKSQVPERILNKPAELTDKEYEEVKKHTVYGYRILEKVVTIKPSAAVAALMHHEKFNGTGYPLGVSADKIHLYARIAAVADIFDAMTSNKSYGKRSSPFEVFSLLESLIYGSLDPRIVIKFLENVAGYYVGDRVSLSDGSEGVIVYINPRAVSKPIIQIDDEIVNLYDPAYNDITIGDVVRSA